MIRQAIQPDFQVFMKFEEGKIEEYDGDLINVEKISTIIFVFKLPLLRTGNHINLEINEDELHLKNAKIYEIFLKIPIKVNEDRANANFDTNLKELTVEIEVRNLLKEALAKVVNEENKENENKIKIVKNQNNIEMKTNLLFDIV